MMVLIKRIVLEDLLEGVDDAGGDCTGAGAH